MFGVSTLDRLLSTCFHQRVSRKLPTESIRFKEMNRLIEANPDKTIPLVDKVFSFDEVISAYAHLQSQKHVGKVVIEVVKA